MLELYPVILFETKCVGLPLIFLANPKSPIFKFLEELRKIFVKLMSLWISFIRNEVNKWQSLRKNARGNIVCAMKTLFENVTSQIRVSEIEWI